MTPTQIRALRGDRTQAEFARLLGLATRGAVSKLESGAYKPTGPLLALLRLLSERGKNSENNSRNTVDSGKHGE